MRRPNNFHCAEQLCKLNAERLWADLIGNKLRTPEEIQKGMACKESEGFSAGNIFRVLRRKRSKLAADQVFCMKTESGNDTGIKAFYADVSFVGGNQVIGLTA